MLNEKDSAQKANAAIGYSANNPEPLALKEESAKTNTTHHDALHSADEYLNSKD
ncbi:MAG TPA: hypothetical protein VGL27_00970 [Negativicutes bacterium]